MDYSRLLVENLGTIDQAVAYIARRHRLARDEAEELAAAVRLKLVDRDYEVLRKYQGRSSLRTYLTAVVHRHFLDERAARWGKWRPSAQARRLGPTGVLLDRLLTRDGLPLAEAATIVRHTHRVTSSDDEIAEMAARLPARSVRRTLGDETLTDLPSPGPLQDSLLQDADRLPEAGRVESALQAALACLQADDRLVLQLKFCEGHQLSTIARLLRMDQGRLYRRVEKVKQILRAELEARGVTQEQVTAILGHPAAEIAPVLSGGGRKPAATSVFRLTERERRG